MTRWLLLILLLLPGIAQAAETVMHNAATANADGQNISVADKGSVGLTVTISGTATVTFKGSADGGSTWTAMNCIALGSTTNVTSTTSSAQYQCAVGGLTHIQAPISGCSGCTVTVRANSSIASRNIGSSSGGLASTDIDTCAEFAAIMTGETGTCGNVVLSQGPTIADPVLTGSATIPNSTTLPATCAVGNIYMDTDATTGQRLYLCESTNTWALQGDGGAGTGMTHPQVMARTSIGF